MFATSRLNYNHENWPASDCNLIRQPAIFLRQNVGWIDLIAEGRDIKPIHERITAHCRVIC